MCIMEYAVLAALSIWNISKNQPVFHIDFRVFYCNIRVPVWRDWPNLARTKFNWRLRWPLQFCWMAKTNSKCTDVSVRQRERVRQSKCAARRVRQRRSVLFYSVSRAGTDNRFYWYYSQLERLINDNSEREHMFHEMHFGVCANVAFCG